MMYFIIHNVLDIMKCGIFFKDASVGREIKHKQGTDCHKSQDTGHCWCEAGVGRRPLASGWLQCPLSSGGCGWVLILLLLDAL